MREACEATFRDDPAFPVTPIDPNSKNSPAVPWLAPVRSLRVLRLSIAAALLASSSVAVFALEPSTPLKNFGRQGWVMENGLPQNTVQALAQTRDGFLWLGTEVGLVRFDGVGFQVFDKNSTPGLPGNDVRCLMVANDGSLWVGTGDGLARLKNGSVTAFTTSNGLPDNSIHAVVEDQSELLMVYTDSGRAKLTGGRFEADRDWRPGTTIAAVSGPEMPGAGGKTDTRSAEGWRQAVAREGLSPDGVEFLAILKGEGVASATKTTLLLPAKAESARLTVGRELPGTRIQALLADREGALWIGTNRGLARWTDGNLQILPVTDVLANASVLSLLEDREGNLWAGTETDGVHILRDQRFRTFGAREGLSSDAISTVVEDKAGTLWAGTSGGGLDALTRTEGGVKATRTYSVRDGLLSDVILSLAAAPNGDLWVGTPDGLNRIRAGRVDSFTSADGLPDDFIRSLLADADGSLWIGTRRGLTHWAGGEPGERTQTYTHSSGLGSDLVGAMAHDSNGDLWVSTLAGLSRIANGKIANYTTADGLSSNVITALLPLAMGRLLVGTQDRGWNLWDGQHFSRVTENGLDRTTIHAILKDGADHLWFATGNGIARCDCNEGSQGMTVASCTHWMEFGAADGLRSRETATNSHPSAWRSRDGTLWFATPKGLVEVDPAHFPVNSAPPPVAIESFAVDDTALPLLAGGSRMRIEAGHSHFQFDFAGLSFVAPQKVRYRYMLEGFDHAWTEAGARRTAYYTNVPAARYTFRVQAANNDGVWNTEGASLNFELEPHFYQTLWFYALLGLAAASLVLLALKIRLRRAEREFNAVLGERNRIAREIHDTLAQGYVGISVQLEVLAELLRQKKMDAAEKQLDTTRGHVRDGLAEARQSIWALRSQDSGESTLPVRLRRLVEAAGGNGFEPKFSLFGAYRPLGGETERELLRIAQEAIHNVKKHADAKNLTVLLEYGPAEVALEVRDDGHGFAAGEDAAWQAGHFGLTGMRERAAGIGGALEVTSVPGAGTTVRLKAPAPRENKETQ
jgi:signal transduction histidine kinase/ligand-binding sensor domain-containing protein